MPDQPLIDPSDVEIDPNDVEVLDTGADTSPPPTPGGALFQGIPAARALSQRLTTPHADQSRAGAMLRGFAGGAIEGLTSPLGLTAASLPLAGPARAAAGMAGRGMLRTLAHPTADMLIGGAVGAMTEGLTGGVLGALGGNIAGRMARGALRGAKAGRLRAVRRIPVQAPPSPPTQPPRFPLNTIGKRRLRERWASLQDDPVALRQYIEGAGPEARAYLESLK